MSKKRFELVEAIYNEIGKQQIEIMDNLEKQILDKQKVIDLSNEQQELIEELHSSDEFGWGRAEKFEKELKQKKIYIKRLEYKVQKFKEMNGEQQATISAFKEENEQLKSTIIHLEEECGARENDYVNLKKQLDKIPKNIREVWKE